MTNKHTLLFVAFLLLYEISAYLSNDMIMPGMIKVIQSYSVSESYVAPSLTAFILGGASLQFLLGPLSDYFNRRPVMLVGVGFFLGVNLLIGFSFTIQQFILLRFLQGMGLCFISVVGYATLHEICCDISAVRITSIMSNITVMAPLAGPLLGVLVLTFFQWPVIFHFIAIGTGISLIGLYFFMPEPPKIIRLEDNNISSSFGLKKISRDYLLLLKNKFFMLSAISMGFSSIPFIAWIGTSPIILMKTAGLDVLTYGLLQIPIFLSAILGTVYMRYLIKNNSLYELIHLSSIILISGLILTTILTIILQEKYYALIIGLCIYIFGQSIGSAALNRLTLYSTPVAKGTTAAAISCIFMILIGLGNQIGGMIYQSHRNLFFSLFCTVCGIFYATTYYVWKNKAVINV